MRPSRVSRYSLALLATLIATSAAAQSIDVRTATVDGVTNGAWSATGLGAPSADGIVLGQPLGQPYINAAPTMVRQNWAGDIRLQNAGDTPVPPTPVDLIALSGDLRAMGIPAEIGALDMDHIEQAIDFQQPFARTPVVFVTQSTANGDQPAYTFASRVDAHGATLKLREPSVWDGWHYVERVRYLAIEPGEYPLPDGRWLSVGAFDTSVGGGYSSRTIWPEVQLHAGATVIGAVQMTESETPAHTLTPFEGPDGQAAFWFGQHNFGDAMGYPMQAGYLLVGDRIAPAAVTLLGNRFDPQTYQWSETGASIEYLTETNNACRAMADYGLDNIYSVELVGAGSGTTTLAFFDGPRCSGQSRTLVAPGAETVNIDNDWQLSQFVQTAKSFRVVHGQRAERLAPSEGEVCFAPGETILDNGPAVLQLTADGDLGIFKRNPADGSLVEAARQPLDADTFCITGPGWMYGQQQPPQLVARRDGDPVWQSQDAYVYGYDPYLGQPMSLVLDGQCGVQMLRGDQPRWGLNTDGCHTALPLPTPDPTPAPKLIFGDVDGDDDPEMVLMLTKADGSGHLMYDPLGIADFFYTVGLPPDADFIPALSQTQREALRHQTQSVVPGGVTTIEQLLDLLDRMHPVQQVNPWGYPMGGSPNTPSLYLTFEFEVAVDVSAVEAEAEWNGFEAEASVGNFEFEMHNDADSFGYNISASAAEVSVGYDGYVTVEASVLSAEAGMYVGNDGVAVGGGADLVGVTFRGGREDRTHIGVSTGVGVGFWAEARWGRDDLYGFTLDLPIFPVGVAIYVRGDDVKWLGARIVWLVDEGLHHGEQLGRVIWSESSSWAVGAYGDSAVFVSNGYNDTRAFVEKTADGALVGIESGADATVAWVEGAGWTLQNTVDSIGDAIETGGQQAVAQVEQVANQAGGWVEGAANDAGSWFEGAANDVAGFFGGLF